MVVIAPVGVVPAPLARCLWLLTRLTDHGDNALNLRSGEQLMALFSSCLAPMPSPYALKGCVTFFQPQPPQIKRGCFSLLPVHTTQFYHCYFLWRNCFISGAHSVSFPPHPIPSPLQAPTGQCLM